MEFKIINSRFEDDPKLVAFYERLYRSGYILTDERYRRWWLHDNPAFGGEGYSAKVAVSGGEFIGHCAYVPVSLWSGGRQYHAAWGGDFIVDKRWRRRGIGRALHRAIYDEVDAFLDVGANVTAEVILRKFGWFNFGPLLRAVAPLTIEAARFSRKPALVSGQLLPALPRRPSALRVRRIKRANMAVDRFWERQRQQIGHATERSAAFLNWRYLDHPIFQYQLFLAERPNQNKENEVVGLAVARLQTVADPVHKLWRIVEFLAEDDTTDELLSCLVEEGRAADAVLIDFFCASTRFLTPFRRAGFVLSPVADQFTHFFDPVDLTRLGAGMISFNGGNIHGRLDPKRFIDRDQWYVTSGDGDQDRPNRLSPKIDHPNL